MHASQHPSSLPSPNAGELSIARPTPRPPRSDAEVAAIRVKNRRREYLERNPAYLKSAEHEFADPLLYDDLVRQFQSPAERESDGKAKGYGRVLEGSLLRGEAKLAQIAPGNGVESGSGSQPDAAIATAREITAAAADNAASLPPPEDRKEATERWEEFLRLRFVGGGDEDFEYSMVDDNEDYDVLHRKDEEEAWFEAEDPDWASLAEPEPEHGPSSDDGQRANVDTETRPERTLQGETGIQDF